MSLWDYFFYVLPFLPQIPMYIVIARRIRRDRAKITPLERAKFKQLRKDIMTIKKSRKDYQRREVINDIFSYMQTRSWFFDGHSEFGHDQKQYYWSAPTLREGKYMHVTVAWNTKYAIIDYISTRVEDADKTVGITEYSNPNKANKVVDPNVCGNCSAVGPHPGCDNTGND